MHNHKTLFVLAAVELAVRFEIFPFLEGAGFVDFVEIVQGIRLSEYTETETRGKNAHIVEYTKSTLSRQARVAFTITTRVYLGGIQEADVIFTIGRTNTQAAEK